MVPDEERQKPHPQRISRATQSGTQRSALLDVEERARAFVAQQPVAAALTAVCVGYFVGRIASRR